MSLKEAVEMYPEYSDEHNAYEPLAEAYLKKGDKAAATDVLKKYLTYSETSFASYVKLSELLEESGDKAGRGEGSRRRHVHPSDGSEGPCEAGQLAARAEAVRERRARIRNAACLEYSGSSDRLLSSWRKPILGDGKRAEARKRRSAMHWRSRRHTSRPRNSYLKF